jgi:5-methylcytosine-specific restriction endonuclease McrA
MTMTEKQKIPTRLRRQVTKRDGYHCVYCDEDLTHKEIHLDHVIPESQGGPTTYDNLQVTCKKCNTAKGILTEEEFVSKLRKRAQNILWRLGSG